MFLPLNQVKLTNVSVVRLKKNGKRFEIACYRNKVLEWRNGIETDLDNVLQTDQVFLNVSKGLLAPKEELMKAFKTDQSSDIVKEILKKGEMQVGEKERNQQLSSMSKDIASIVSDMCVNPETKRPYPISTVEKLISDLHFSINTNKNAKQQALEIIKMLEQKQIVPIARAQMRIRITCPGKEGKKLKEKLSEHLSSIEDEDFSDTYELIALINPGAFRILSDKIQTESKGRAQLEVLNIKESIEGDVVL